MEQIKQHDLAVTCKNHRAHMLVHLIPIPERFRVKTTVKCDVCGDESEYSPDDILVAFGTA
jgi:hypothetical protein